MTIWLALARLVAALSYWITKLVHEHALKAQWLDHPNLRGSHVCPTPRGAGVHQHAHALNLFNFLDGIGLAMGRPARLLSIPPAIEKSPGTLVGRGGQVRRLLGSLQVDPSARRELLEWDPSVSVDSALARTAAHFLKQVQS